MSRFNQNSQIRSAPLMLSTQNRALQYGDALFETIRLVHGTIPMLSYHWERLERGMRFLGFFIPENWGIEFLKTEIYRLSDELQPKRDQQFFRIRLQVFRRDGGLYRPLNSQPAFIITASPLETQQFIEDLPGLHLGLFEQQSITPAPLSNHKTCNSLVYILAGKYAVEQGYDECVLLNAQRQVAEGYYSNLFIKQKDTWLTPPLSVGGVAGTLRAYLLDHAKQLGIKAEESILNLSDIESAHAIWLTNAIRGIEWVKRYKNTTFGRAETRPVIQKLNEAFDPGS